MQKDVIFAYNIFTCKSDVILLKIHFYAKRKIVPRDQVAPLIVVYCLLLLHKNK